MVELFAGNNFVFLAHILTYNLSGIADSDYGPRKCRLQACQPHHSQPPGPSKRFSSFELTLSILDIILQSDGSVYSTPCQNDYTKNDLNKCGIDILSRGLPRLQNF